MKRVWILAALSSTLVMANAIAAPSDTDKGGSSFFAQKWNEGTNYVVQGEEQKARLERQGFEQYTQ